jgi:hypothetical protein
VSEGYTQVAAAKSSLRLVDNTLYFLNNPPDKVKSKDFKDQKAIETHYAALLAAIKKRNPIQDARFAFDHGMRVFLTYNGVTVEQGRGNPLGLGFPELEKRCPGSATRLNNVEGVRFIQTGQCQSSSASCQQYASFIGDSYMRPWNKEMARLCHGGKFPK